MKGLKSILILLVLTMTSLACKDEMIELGVAPEEDPMLILSDRQVGLEIGSSAKLSIRYVDADGSTDDNPSVSWSIEDPSIIDLDASGNITPISLGQSLVTASYNGASSSASLVTIVADDLALARIDVVPDSIETDKDKQHTLDYTAWNLRGDRLNDGAVAWTSSDVNVAEVNQLGQVVTRDRGLAELELVIDGIRSLPVSVAVNGDQKSGSLSGAGDYDASGIVTLQELPDGSLELRLADSFSVDAGPKLDIYLGDSSRVDGDSIKLGLLRSFTGAQSFAVPSRVNLDDISYVIVHCTTYDQPFGQARIL